MVFIKDFTQDLSSVSVLLDVLFAVRVGVLFGLLGLVVVIVGWLGSGFSWSGWYGGGGGRSCRDTVETVAAANDSLLHPVEADLLLPADPDVDHSRDQALHLPQLSGESPVLLKARSHPLVLVVAATNETKQESGHKPQENKGGSIQETVQEQELLCLLGLGGLDLGTDTSPGVVRILYRSFNGLREERFFLLLGKD